MDENNIFLLRETWKTISKRPEKHDEVRKEIIVLCGE